MDRDAPAPAGRGRLFVLSGPSGVGKSTVLERVRELLPGLWYSVSATTRAMRPGECSAQATRTHIRASAYILCPGRQRPRRLQSHAQSRQPVPTSQTCETWLSS